METRLRHLTDIAVTTGPARSIRTDWFVGNLEAKLGQAVGVTQFGVNHVRLEPGSVSALRHWHEGEDEFVYVLSGEDENGEHVLVAGSFAGFPAGEPNGHHLANRSKALATFLSLGTRKPGLETIHYPDDFAAPQTVQRDAAGRRVGA